MREAANKALEEVFDPGELELRRQTGGEALTGKRTVLPGIDPGKTGRISSSA